MSSNLQHSQAAADCECGYASQRLRSASVITSNLSEKRKSPRTASFIRSIPQSASTLARARRAAPRSRTAASTCPLRTLSAARSLLRSLLRTALSQGFSCGSTPHCRPLSAAPAAVGEYCSPALDAAVLRDCLCDPALDWSFLRDCL